MKKLINTCIFQCAELPNIDVMREYAELNTIPEELQPLEVNNIGFCPHPTLKESVTEMGTGYAMHFRYDEKIIPASVVSRKVKEYIAQSGEETVNSARRAQIKDTVLATLLPVALVRQKHFTAFYHKASNQLLLTNIPNNLAGRLQSFLVTTCGAIRFSSILIDGVQLGLTARLTKWAGGANGSAADPFAPFSIGQYAKLKMIGEDGVQTFKGDLARSEHGLQDALRLGYRVAEIELCYEVVEGELLIFTMTENYRLRSIRREPGIVVEQDGYAEVNDDYADWRASALIEVRELVDAMKAFIGLFPVQQKP